MVQKIKVTAKIKKHGSDETEMRDMLMVITDKEDIEKVVQMAYGSWYDIVEYTHEPANIYVSTSYCNMISAKCLENGLAL